VRAGVASSRAVRLTRESVVAVHGLGGHRTASWTYDREGNPVLWLKELLPDQLCDARIMSFGYSLKGKGIVAAEITDTAVKLLDRLLVEREADDVSGPDTQMSIPP
jgi:hypothetical protein